MECVDWAGTRLGMIKLADVKARQDLYQHWRPPSPQNQKEEAEGSANGGDVFMNDSPLKDVEMQDAHA